MRPTLGVVAAACLVALAVLLIRWPAPATGPGATAPEATAPQAPSPRADRRAVAGPSEVPSARPVGADTAFDCPVTEVPGDFAPPEPWPQTPFDEGLVWFGTADLWTVVAVGDDLPRKSIWWSAKFVDGARQPTPQLSVRHERLDVPTDPIISPAPATNAFTPEYGWLMLNGREPTEPGCWQATGTFDGVSLSYVFERSR